MALRSLLICLGFVFIGPTFGMENSDPWQLDLDIFVRNDDNINRGLTAADEQDDQITGVSGDLSYFQELAENSALIYSTQLGYESYNSFDGLSNTTLDAAVEYRFKTRQGFSAPIYSIDLTVGVAEYDSDMRDGSSVELAVTVFKRITDKISLAAGASSIEKDAESVVFDISQTRAYGVLNYSFSQRHSLAFQYDMIDGDIVSSVVPQGSNIVNSIYWNAWAVDDAISYYVIPGIGYWQNGMWLPPSMTWANRNAWAYRIDGGTQVGRLRYGYAVSRSQSLLLELENYDSDVNGGFEYSGSQSRIDYLIRF